MNAVFPMGTILAKEPNLLTRQPIHTDRATVNIVRFPSPDVIWNANHQVLRNFSNNGYKQYASHSVIPML